MKLTGFFGCLALLLISMSALAPGLYAQTVSSTLSGKIVDASGAVIPKASISVANVATGLTRTAQSSDVGEYNVPLLPPGDYAVSVEYAGFGKEIKDITLQVGQVASLRFHVRPGTEEKVEVTAGSELVEPTRTEVSSVITERQIVDLPVNGREFINFALLSPAVHGRRYHLRQYRRDRRTSHQALLRRTEHPLQLHRRRWFR